MKSFIYRLYSAGFATDEYYEFGKKFDIGIDLLDGIKTNTGETKGTLNKINETMESFVAEQKGHNYWMKEHNQRLEKILERLAER